MREREKKVMISQKGKKSDRKIQERKRERERELTYHDGSFPVSVFPLYHLLQSFPFLRLPLSLLLRQPIDCLSLSLTLSLLVSKEREDLSHYLFMASNTSGY
jgi:hypothetical protein